jgi:hypothetical protein
VAGLSIISSPAGMMPAAMMSATALPAFTTSSKEAIDHLGELRLRRQLHRRLEHDAEHAFRADHQGQEVVAGRIQSPSLPISTTVPSISATRRRSTLCTVRPYFRQCTPPEFSATLPPMVQAIWLEGSGA